ncbi:MAG: zf-HC2 domain-containing protein [Gemmatimonadota bacterium]|nr:zf-HC2 domain-containing protein [Gemmatimonadota bacterium]
MTCQDVDLQLDAYIDGTLAPGERAAVDAHLTQCAACREALEKMRRLLLDSRALPQSITPARDLWAGIAPRLAPPEPARVPGWRAPSSPIGLAAAAILLLALGGAIGATLSHRLRPATDTGFTAARARYAAATATLAEQLAADPALLAVTTRSVIAQDLGILDAAIREAGTALAADPGNAALELMLLAREQQRIDLLERALRAGRQES